MTAIEVRKIINDDMAFVTAVIYNADHKVSANVSGDLDSVLKAFKKADWAIGYTPYEDDVITYLEGFLPKP